MDNIYNPRENQAKHTDTLWKIAFDPLPEY